MKAKTQKLIPDGYRPLQDGEIITEDCLCSGLSENNTYGWWIPPKHLVGKPFIYGWCRHPDFIAVKEV